MSRSFEFKVSDDDMRFLDLPWFGFFSLDGYDLYLKLGDHIEDRVFGGADNNYHQCLPVITKGIMDWEERVYPVEVL